MAERAGGFKLEQITYPAANVLAVATGAAVGEFVGEAASSALGVADKLKLLVKGVVKGVIGLTAYIAHLKVPLGWASIFLESFAYGSWASIVIDIINYLVPGGIAAAGAGVVSTLRGVKQTTETATQKLSMVKVKHGGEMVVRRVV